jgi:carboxylate-amine ligase
MIDFGLQEEVETRMLIDQLLDFVDDVVDELEHRDHINYVHQILKMEQEQPNSRFEQTTTYKVVDL